MELPFASSHTDLFLKKQHNKHFKECDYDLIFILNLWSLAHSRVIERLIALERRQLNDVDWVPLKVTLYNISFVNFLRFTQAMSTGERSTSLSSVR